MRLKKCLFALLAMLWSATFAVYSQTTVSSEEDLATALASGGEVTIGTNITVNTMLTIPTGVQVTLDLNGYSLTGAATSDTRHIYVLDNCGSITIKGTGTISGRGIYNGYNNGNSVTTAVMTIEPGVTINGVDTNGGYAVGNYGKLTMNGGSINVWEDNPSDAATSGNLDATALNNASGAEATINGGTITSTTNFTYAINNSGILTIPSSSTVSVSGAHGAVSSSGTVTIDGGTFICTGIEGQTDNVVYVHGGAATINGGEFTADSDTPAGGCCVSDVNGGSIINGGTFSNSSGGDVWGTTGTTINGGTFENLTETSYVTVGSTITNGGTTYTKTENGLEEVTIAAKIGTTTYETLALAFEAATSGDVIDLYQSVSTFPVISKAVTFRGAVDGVEINYELAQNFADINGTVKFENLTFNKSLFTEYGGSKPNLVIEFEGCKFNVSADQNYGMLIGTSGTNSVVKGLKVNNCNFKYVGTTFKGGYMLYVQCVQNVTITNNTLDGNNLYRGAIHLGDATEWATVATVQNNTIKNFCRGVMSGNRVEGSVITIDGNTFENINYNSADSKAEAECAPIFIHANASAETTSLVVTNNAVVACNNPMIYSEDTDPVADYVTTFTGNTTKTTADATATSIELANSYNAPNAQVIVAKIGATGYTTLQLAIDAVQNGDEIVLQTECGEDVTITQNKAVSLVLNGNGMNYTGQIKIVARAGKDEANTLTIKNFNFKPTDDTDQFIYSVENNYYPNNVTISGCTFEGSGSGSSDVPVTMKSASNLVVENCTATKVHSLLQNTSGWNITVRNCTVTEAGRGMSLSSAQGVLVENVEIDALDTKYGIRLDAAYASTTTIKDCKIAAFIPVVVRNASANYTLVIDGTNTMTPANTDNLWCAIGTSEYETNGTMPTAATGKVRVTLNDSGLNASGIYDAYAPVAKIGDTEYQTLAEAIDAAAENDVITLIDDVDLTSTLNVAAGKTVVLDLNGKVIDGREKCNIAIISYGNLTIRDTSADADGAIKAGKTSGNSGNTINVCGGTFTLKSGNIYSVNNAVLIDENAATVNIDGGTITAESTTRNSAAFYISSVNETIVNISGGEIVGYNGILLWNNTTLNITGGSIEAKGSLAIQGNGSKDNTEINISGDATVTGYYAAIYHPQGGKLNISGGTLSGWTGVVVKGGIVNISGGVINGTGEANDYVAVSSGFQDTGDALYVEHYDSSTSSENYGTPVVTVTGGTFNSTNAQPIANYANANNSVEALSAFVSGGTFSAQVAESLLVEGFTCTQNGDGTYGVVEKTLAGEGTQDNPYLISNIDELFFFAQKVNAGYSFKGEFVKLAASIDLATQAVMLASDEVTPNWEAVGTTTTPFEGTFDGNNETISNMVVVGEACQGFFGYANTAKIKNLKLANVTVKGTDCVGAVAGQVYSSSLVDNCHVSGTIQVEGQTNVGGIVGKYYTKVTNCSVIGDGVETSYVKGVYVASDLEGDNVGGIMGHCGENNTLTGHTVKNITISGTRKVGGIVGIADQNTDIDNCVVDNVVIETTATADYANSKLNSMSIGAIIGQYQAAKTTNDGTVTNSTVKNVTFSNVNDVTVDVGPIVGGARGGSNAMLAPSADITATGNIIQLATITGSNNLYLMSPVAKIGDTEYYTFEKALEAAHTGETIVLLGNVLCAEEPVYTEDGIVNVDVNGHIFISSAKERVRNVASADGTVASNNIKFVSGFGWEVYNSYSSFVASEENNFRVFPTLQEAVDYNPETVHDVARIYPYENVKQTSDITLRASTLGTSSTICLDPEYSITWDLNGCTVLQETPTGNPLEACIRGTFTLDDTSAAKTGKWIAGACGVKDTANSWYGNGGPAFYVLGDGKLILKGGTVSIARNTDANGETINNGTGLVRVDSGSLFVDGATLLVEDTYGIMVWGGSAVVNSGTFKLQGNGAYSIFAMKYFGDATVTVNSPIDGYMLIHSSASATVNAENVSYYADDTNYVAPTLADGYVALPDLNGYYVVGSEPTATVNNLGSTTVAANDYILYPSGSNTTDMPLSFVMQFLADQTAEDMETSPFADWYADFVITFTGIEDGSFVGDGCYLAGNYGTWGWIKIPVDGMTIEEGARYPVMLSMWGAAQTYDYICTGVKDFKCALYLTPEVLAANPNIKVNLELSIIDSSKGVDAATSALTSGENIYTVASYDYDAVDFSLYEGADVVIEDGALDSFNNPNAISVNSITYNRTLPADLLWNTWYVPFRVPVSTLTALGIEVAYFNDVHSEGEGENIKMYTEFRKIESGTLRENHPYMFRRTSADAATELNIVLEDATLYSTAESAQHTVEVTSAYVKFEVKGTYSEMSSTDLAEARVLSVEDANWAYLEDGYTLNPFRVYLVVTESNDSPVLPTIGFRFVDVDGNPTSIEAPETDANADDAVYDLQGRRVLHPANGIYIVNGKKVIFK